MIQCTSLGHAWPTHGQHMTNKRWSVYDMVCIPWSRILCTACGLRPACVPCACGYCLFLLLFCVRLFPVSPAPIASSNTTHCVRTFRCSYERQMQNMQLNVLSAGKSLPLCTAYSTTCMDKSRQYSVCTPPQVTKDLVLHIHSAPSHPCLLPNQPCSALSTHRYTPWHFAGHNKPLPPHDNLYANQQAHFMHFTCLHSSHTCLHLSSVPCACTCPGHPFCQPVGWQRL